MGEERLGILKMLEDGQIGVEEAAELLAALRPEAAEERPRGEDGEQDGATPSLEKAEPVVEVAAPAPQREGMPGNLSRFWIYPAMAGGGLLVVGAALMGLFYAANAATGWRVCCGWVPMIVGLLVALLALWSRTARWLHLRISEQGKRKMAFSFPLPLTLTAWVVRIAQRFVPQLKETAVDEVIIALRDSDRDEPFSVDVQDGEDGERVQVYIG